MRAIPGFRLLPGYLSRDRQAEWVTELKSQLRQTPFYTPTMPRTGRPMSVRMASMGQFGWWASRSGYVYLEAHPETRAPFPAIPEPLLDVWRDVVPDEAAPDACLINFYNAAARMGLHADLDEEDRSAPVVSISLGDTAVFRLGGPHRKDPTFSFRLASGDVMVLEGPMRDAYHGVDRIIVGSSTLLEKGGRLNVTLRRVKPV